MRHAHLALSLGTWHLRAMPLPVVGRSRRRQPGGRVERDARSPLKKGTRGIRSTNARLP